MGSSSGIGVYSDGGAGVWSAEGLIVKACGLPEGGEALAAVVWLSVGWPVVAGRVLPGLQSCDAASMLQAAGWSAGSE